MKIGYMKKFPHTGFSIETESVANRPGTWNSTKVSIFLEDSLIGEYLRNYSSFGKETFYPFLATDNEWYALYSPHYTATRVMKLHEDRIEDWCGEEPAGHGFCPTEFYIPRYVHSRHTLTLQDKTDTYDSYTVDCDVEEEEFEKELHSSEFVSSHYTNFGFLCGCVWGDDTSWKLRHIDLSKIPEKQLIITDKFGYWELSNDLNLKESIRMDGWEPGHNWINITGAKYINLDSGEFSS